MTSFVGLLADLDAETDLVAGLATARRVADAARSADPATTVPALAARLDGDDLAALAAREALAAVPDDDADRLLVDRLDDHRAAVREHAAWRLASRLPARHAYGRLIAVVADGGFAAMIAQSTLVGWARVDDVGVTAALDGALALATDPLVRERLVVTLGAVDGSTATTLLRRIALDDDEADPARIAAIGGLTDHPDPDVGAVLRHLADEPGDLGAHAALALDDRDGPTPVDDDSPGLHIAQLTLVGDLDGQLSRGGTGDTGGVASLLVSASAALSRHDDVAHVLTIGRGSVTDVVAAELAVDADGEAFAAVTFGAGGRAVTDLADAWEHRLTIERGIRRVLRHRPRVDVLHLRMADVGTLAAATVAEERGVPVVFSLAPDPHGVVRSLQAQGRVDRASIGELDGELHVWFRARLVEQLAREAASLALFPRLDPGRVLVDLGLDPDETADRARVVAEGVDVDALRRAEQAVAAGRAELADEVAARLPHHRWGRPLLVSAGRLHPVKGMDRVVAAWAHDPDLRERFNLVIVGGDLVDPSPTERRVLGAIDRVVGGDANAQDGLVMLGGRPRQQVGRLLAVAARGHADAIAPGGIYVNGAAKEEFGLALVEALAVGLTVVAPSAGGPATYVDDGVTGVLVDPDGCIGAGIHRAAELVDRPGRIETARALVDERYSVDAMAAALVDLYRPTPALR
ncbi:MAG TPA: glycosyltransferase [Acidimicrobiales bacterium]|nr:glycosyltransferase [Acidimicrobiales bacterium]